MDRPVCLRWHNVYDKYHVILHLTVCQAHDKQKPRFLLKGSRSIGLWRAGRASLCIDFALRWKSFSKARRSKLFSEHTRFPCLKICLKTSIRAPLTRYTHPVWLHSFPSVCQAGARGTAQHKRDPLQGLAQPTGAPGHIAAQSSADVQ